MAKCYYHPYQNVSTNNGSVCSRCKSCKHKSFYKKGSEYRCNKCNFKTKYKPKNAEIWEVIDGEWKKI